MSFQKTVLLQREGEPGNAGGGGEAPPAKNFGYNEPQEVAAEPPKTEAPPATTPPAAQPSAAAPPDTADTPPPPTVPPVNEPPVFDWKKEVKNIPQKEVLKELGLDDFEIDLLEYKKKTGDLTPYLKAKTVDYTKMSAEELLKSDLREKNPGMSEASLNFKFNKEFQDKYFLNREDYPENSVEANFGQEQLRLDAEAKRKEFIETQQNFRAPEPRPDLETAQREAELQETRTRLGNEVLNNEATTALSTNKSVQIGEGEESFTYPVADVDKIIENVMSLIQNSGRTDLKGVDLKYLYEGIVIGANKKAFLESFGKHQRALEFKRIQAELGNTTPPNNELGTPPPPAKNYGYGG